MIKTVIKKLIPLFLISFSSISFANQPYQLSIITKNNTQSSEYIDIHVCDRSLNNCQKEKNTLTTYKKKLIFNIQVVRLIPSPKKTLNVTYTDGCPNPVKTKLRTCQIDNYNYDCVDTKMSIPNTGSQGNQTLTITFESSSTTDVINITARCVVS